MIRQDNIPDYWKIKKASQLGRVVTGGTPDTNIDEYWDGEIPWLRVSDIGGNLFVNDSKDTITEQGLREGSCSLLNKGSVVIATRATIGEVAIAGSKLATNQGFKSIEPDSSIDNKFLAYYILSISDYLKSLGKGATFDEVNKTQIENLDIPVPPLDEQERIVEVVEERLERVGKLEKSVENVGRLAKEYRDSLTEYLFIGRESLSASSPNQIPAEDDIPNHWSSKTIGEVSSQIRTGGTPKKSRDDFWGGDIPWKASKHFNENSLQLSESSEYVTEKGKSESTMANPDDVVIVCRGAHTGKVGLVKSEFLFNQDVKVIRLPENINPEFVARYLSNHMEYFLQKQRGGTTKGITTSHVKNLRIPIPPSEEQKNIVNKVKSIDFDRVFKAVSDVDTHFEEYRDSVLAHAFNGQVDY